MDENFKNWHDILEEFRKTELYKTSKGMALMPKFFEWLYQNYKVPEKLKK